MTTKVTLTARDEEVIYTCGRVRAITSSALQRLLFATRRDTMLRRLSQLHSADFLAVTSRSRTEEHIWRLGAAGRVWLRARGHEPGRCPRPEALAHHLGVVASWVSVAAACQARPGFRLITVFPDWEFRAQPGNSATLVVPDLLASVETPAGRHTLAFEIDRGTEPLHVLRQKLDRYAFALASPTGFHDTATLTLVFVLVDVGPGRARSIKQLLAASWGYPFHVVLGLSESLDPLLSALADTPQPNPPGAWGVSSPVSGSVSMAIPVFKRPL